MPISTTFLFDPAGGGGSYTINTSVTVYNITPNSFSFVTDPGHPLYPADIKFSAEDVGNGQIEFSINVSAQIDGTANEILFDLAGSAVEDSIWENMIRNVKKFCSQ